jgi:predicted glycosyltransferase
MLAPPIGSTGDGIRILYYSHDSYGLGHLRRTLALAHQVRAELPDATQLIVSGASHTDGWSLPAGADWLKLPAVVKAGAGDYRPRSLECSFDSTLELRKDIVLAASRRFRPDFFVVDHVPDGLDGEALPALRQAAANGARLVLGMRDVLDRAVLVRRSWRKARVYRLLDELYHRIVVYGDASVYDVAAEYEFSPAAAAKTRYVGYLRAPSPAPPETVRRQHELGDARLVVVTAGGGGDGFPLLAAALDSFAAAPLPDAQVVAVCGPLMDDVDRQELERRAARCATGVRLVTAVPDLADLVAAADAVVSMAGYNTVGEILTYRRPALLVPRVRPRVEQLIRATALKRRGLVRVVHPDVLTPERLRVEILRLLAAGPPPASDFSLDGLDGFVGQLEELAASARDTELPLVRESSFVSAQAVNARPPVGHPLERLPREPLS